MKGSPKLGGQPAQIPGPLTVGFVLDYIPDQRFIPRGVVLERDSYTDRWLRALADVGVTGVKYVPWRGIRKTESHTHRFGHKVKLVPVTHPLIPTHLSSAMRETMGGATSPFYRLETMAFTVNLLRELKRDGVDLVHYANYFASSFAFAPLVSTVTPYVTWNTGGLLPRSRAAKWTYFFSLRPAMIAVRIVMIGDYATRRRILDWLLKGDTRKVRSFQLLRADRQLFRPGDKEASGRRLGYPQKEVNVVCVQSLIPLRNDDPDHRQPFLLVETLSKAKGSLKGKAVSLTIIGTGPGLEPLKQLARDLGMEQNVRFLGRVEHEQLPMHYAACDAVFVPFRIEALNESHVLGEAFSCARPVIAFRSSDRSPMDQPGGYLISDSPERGGVELAAILGDSSSLRKKGEDAFALSPPYDLSTAGSELLKVYREALAG